MTGLTARQRWYATFGMGGYYGCHDERSGQLLAALWFRGTMTAVCALETAFRGGRP